MENEVMPTQPDSTDDDLRTIMEIFETEAPPAQDDMDDNNLLRKRIMNLEEALKQLDNRLQRKIKTNNRLMSEIECDACLYEKLHNGDE